MTAESVRILKSRYFIDSKVHKEVTEADLVPVLAHLLAVVVDVQKVVSNQRLADALARIGRALCWR